MKIVEKYRSSVDNLKTLRTRDVALSDSIQMKVYNNDRYGNEAQVDDRIEKLTSLVGVLAEVLLRNNLLSKDDLAELMHYSHHIED